MHRDGYVTQECPALRGSKGRPLSRRFDVANGLFATLYVQEQEEDQVFKLHPSLREKQVTQHAFQQSK
jgi:hypothetical protein